MSNNTGTRTKSGDQIEIYDKVDTYKRYQNTFYAHAVEAAGRNTYNARYFSAVKSQKRRNSVKYERGGEGAGSAIPAQYIIRSQFRAAKFLAWEINDRAQLELAKETQRQAR
ncbi:hypothetical protein EVAR_14752_1 [Eumeta japonica]|uniref:Uncharacterized protein n=1 Tax=Eumeta variegata TaxID=151549 RepID=A0A4C1TWE7_EUMVA|nr:hypothetical protein EVAR_14752_1 [Eumeta japonica]